MLFDLAASGSQIGPVVRLKALKQVAILVDSASGWGRRIIEGILAQTLEHHRWHIWIAPMDRVGLTFLPKGWKGDGIIARIPTLKTARYLAQFKVPVVNVSSIALPGEQYPRIMPDHEVACQLALDHLSAKGFKRFGYVGPVRMPWVRAHFAAFQKVLSAQGLRGNVFTSPPDFSSQRDWEEWLSSLTEWLRVQPKPIAVLTWSPSLGREVVEACRMADILVPHEVAVLGSNSDGLLDRACDPPLAGVDEPCFEMGRLAANYLDRLLTDKGSVPALTRVKPTRIIQGGSTDTLAVDDPLLVQAMRYIDAHAFDEDMSVEKLLEIVPVARRSMERRFRDTFGRSLVEEIRARRIAKARTLLLETDLPMPEIAQACGYSTYNYLHLVFKKAMGIAPSRFRLENRVRQGK